MKLVKSSCHKGYFLLVMGVNYLSVSALFSVLSFFGLQWWAELSLEKLKSDGLIVDFSINSGIAAPALELLLGSYVTVAFLVNFAISVFILLSLWLKCVFFGELYASETRKLVERLVNYAVYKGAFLPLVIPLTKFQIGLWSTWLTVLCSLKMFQTLARDRLERLNASPSATPWTYFRVFSMLPLVMFLDLLWIRLCWVTYGTIGSSMFILLFFEPFGILFETLQAIVVHGFQLLDMWLHHSAERSTNCQRSRFFDLTAAGSLSEIKGILVRNLGFFLDMLTLIMALSHYAHIWLLHGMAFHVVDVVLFLNIRALLSAIVKRIRGFVKLRMALGTLHGALPNATSEEIQAYDDECAICREPMAKAKKLSCNHLFHLACLRSWLDQGISETLSCPTCRKPLFVQNLEETSQPTRETSNDELLAHQISNEQNPSGSTVPNPSQNPLESGTWRLPWSHNCDIFDLTVYSTFPFACGRNKSLSTIKHGGSGLDSSWMHTWPNQGLDGAGPSSAIGSVGFGRFQMMMRHFAAVGETYAQTALEDSAWNLWPVNPSQSSGSTIPDPSVRYPATGTTGLRMRNTPQSTNDNIANILAMAEIVREVLPHIPDELIFQDLQQTNSATVTVNNLLQM